MVASKYRKVYQRIWKDETFRSLDDDGKLMTLYLITGQSNRVGVYVFSAAMGAEDLRWTPARFGRVLDRVIRAFRWGFDQASRVLYIRSWWKWNPPDSDRQFRQALSDLADVPRGALVDAFFMNVDHLGPVYQTLLESYATAVGWIACDRSATDPGPGGDRSESGSGPCLPGAGTGLGTGAGTGTEKRAGARDPVFEVPIPASIDTTEFGESWLEWIDYRRRDKKVPVTPRAAKQQLADLAEVGPIAAIAAIRKAIASNWQGIFPDKPKAAPPPRAKPFQPANTDPRRPVVEVEEP